MREIRVSDRTGQVWEGCDNGNWTGLFLVVKSFPAEHSTKHYMLPLDRDLLPRFAEESRDPDWDEHDEHDDFWVRVL